MSEIFILGIFVLVAIGVMRLLWSLVLKPGLAKFRATRTVIHSHVAAHRIPDEAYYEMAAAEVSAGNIRPGLWAKAVSETLGDETKAAALYIKFRVRSMRQEAASVIRRASDPANRFRSTSTDSQGPPPESGSDAFAEKTVISCPYCKAKLRVPSGRTLDIRCPPCGGTFRQTT